MSLVWFNVAALTSPTRQWSRRAKLSNRGKEPSILRAAVPSTVEAGHVVGPRWTELMLSNASFKETLLECTWYILNLGAEEGRLEGLHWDKF